MVTFALAAFLALAALVLPNPAPAHAAVACSTSWHTIKASEVGLNVKPYSNTALHAWGGNDYWNQQFLFCRDPNWGANHYGIYSNATGKYCNGLISVVYCNLSGIPNVYALFEVKPYDGTFWTIKEVGNNAYVYPDVNGGNQLKANRGLILTGSNLFEIYPRNPMG
jgi:hypothetical protein